LSVEPRGKGEAPLEGTDEAGVVLISYEVGDLLDLHVAGGEEMRRLLQSALGERRTDIHTGYMLEQPLQTRGTEAHLASEFTDGPGRLLFDHLQYLLQALFTDEWCCVQGTGRCLLRNSIGRRGLAGSYIGTDPMV
jgi:hypothetical protein